MMSPIQYAGPLLLFSSSKHVKCSGVEYVGHVCCEYRMLYLLGLIRVGNILRVMILFSYACGFRITFCSFAFFSSFEGLQ